MKLGSKAKTKAGLFIPLLIRESEGVGPARDESQEQETLTKNRREIKSRNQKPKGESISITPAYPRRKKFMVPLEQEEEYNGVGLTSEQNSP